MSRSRIVLMMAWCALAAGSVVHFVQSDADGGVDRAEQGPSADPPDALAAGTSSRRVPIPEPRDVEQASSRSSGSTVGGDEPGGDHSGARSPILLDDPRRWADALPRPPAVVATVTGTGVASRTGPGTGPETHWFTNPTQFDGPRTFLVVDDTSSNDHVKVSLPVMPNGQEGWIPRSAVELSTVTHRAEVDLSEATVTVWDGDDLVVTTRAVTGRPSAPTPLGRFYVRDIIAQPNPDGDYGPWILALSGFSEVLATFDGGLPALALHGTDEPEEIGTALSSGCVRVPNDVITTLAETVPLGTPVTIVA